MLKNINSGIKIILLIIAILLLAGVVFWIVHKPDADNVQPREEEKDAVVLQRVDALDQKNAEEILPLIYKLGEKYEYDGYNDDPSLVSVFQNKLFIYERNFTKKEDHICHLLTCYEEDGSKEIELDSIPEDYVVESICVSSDRIFAAAYPFQSTSFEENDNGPNKRIQYLFVFDTEGNEICVRSFGDIINEELPDLQQIVFLPAADREVYVYFPEALIIGEISSDGRCTGKIRLGGAPGAGVCSLKNSTGLAGFTTQDGQACISVMNTASGSSDTFKLDGITVFPYMFSGTQFDLYLMNDLDLYGADLKNRTVQKLITFTSYGIDYTGIFHISDDSEGNLRVFQEDRTERKTKMVILKPFFSEETQQIRISCLESTELLRYAVSKYNAGNPEVRAVLYEYYDRYQSDASLEDALIKMNSDIAAGTCGDIVCLDHIGSSAIRKSFARKGALIDLYDLMERDEAFHMEDFFIQVWKANEIDSALYSIIPLFSVNTKYGSYEDTGDQTHVDEDVLFSIEKPEMLFGSSYTRPAFIHDLCVFSLGDANDPYALLSQTEKLTRYIEFAGLLPEEYSGDDDWSEYAKLGYKDICDLHYGRQQFFQVTALFPQNLLTRYFYNLRKASAYFSGSEAEPYNGDWSQESLSDYYRNIGARVRFSGFPVKEGCGSAFINLFSLAIPTSCEHLDTAWNFIKFTLSDEFQKGELQYRLQTIPVNMNVFREDVSLLMQNSGDFNIDPYWGLTIGTPDYITGEMIECAIPPLQPWMVEEFNSLMDDITRIDETDPVIEEIFSEEITKYSDQRCDSAQAAEMIQTRVQLYLSETGE